MTTTEAETIAAVERLAGQSYAGCVCTLDGQRARVIGRLDSFGTVAILPNGPSHEYAWSTIARVMQHGGRRFQS